MPSVLYNMAMKFIINLRKFIKNEHYLVLLRPVPVAQAASPARCARAYP